MKLNSKGLRVFTCLVAVVFLLSLIMAVDVMAKPKKGKKGSSILKSFLALKSLTADQKAKFQKLENSEDGKRLAELKKKMKGGDKKSAEYKKLKAEEKKLKKPFENAAKKIITADQKKEMQAMKDARKKKSGSSKKKK